MNLVALCALIGVTAQQEVLFEWSGVNYADTCDQPFKPANNVITGLKYWKGTYYVSVPRWQDGVPSTLNTIETAPSGVNNLLKPYPSCAMNKIGDSTAFQYVQSMEIDTQGRMWVIDVGRINIFNNSLSAEPASLAVAPKIVIIDLESGQVLRSTELPDSHVSHRWNFLNDIVIDEVDMVAYLSDTMYNEANEGAIHVYDYNSGTVRTFTGVSTQVELPAAGGPIFTYVNSTGQWVTYPVENPSDSIALTPDRSQLFYAALAGTTLYSLPTSALKNFGLSETAWRAALTPVDHGRKHGPSDGMAFAADGNLYFGDVVNYSLYKWKYTAAASTTANVSTATLVAHSLSELGWIDTFGFDGAHNLLLTSNKLQEFFFSTYPEDTPNFRVLKVPIGANSYLSAQKQDDEEETAGMGAGAIAGIIVGVVAVAGLAAFAFFRSAGHSALRESTGATFFRSTFFRSGERKSEMEKGSGGDDL